MPKVLVAIACTLVAVLAGCASTEPPAARERPALAGGWTLDCALGSHERALAPWAQDCAARASHTAGQKQEIWLAVNPRDADNVVLGAKDLNPNASANCVWNGLAVTHDGGATWKDVLIGGNYADRTSASPYYGYACNTDPMGVFTADGVLHWVVELYNIGGKDGNGPAGADPTSGRGIVQPGWKLVLAQSDDGGDSFPDSKAVTLEYGDGIGLLNDYSRVTVNPKTQSVVTVINSYYPGFGANTALIPAPPMQPPVSAYPGGVFCSILTYKGKGQPVQPVPIQPTAATGTANPGSLNCNAIVGAPDGNLVLAALGAPLGGGGFGAYFATSSDDGASFSDFKPGFGYTPIPSPFTESKYRTGTNFEMAVDATNGTHHGTLYVITAEQTAADPGREADEADIVVRSSTDLGVTWSGPVRVNRDPAGAHQFMPNVVVARDGSVHAFWMDKAFESKHTFIDVTHGISLDAGQTWRTERVTNVSWDGELGKHQEGFPFIGDYTGIGASGSVVWAGFPDASNGKTTVMAAIRSTLK